MKVSIVIPVFNASKTLNSTLRSLQCQTLKDFEVIMIDDGSSDNSAKIINDFILSDQRFHLYKQPSKGAGAARNLGLSQAQGETVMFLDADDIFAPYLLETAYNQYVQARSQVVIYNHQRWDAKEQRLLPNKRKTVQNYLSTFSPSMVADEIFQIGKEMPWNKLIDRNFLQQTKIRFQEIPYGNDIYFSIAVLAAAEQITVIDDVLIYYVVNQNKSLSSHANQETINCRIKAFQELYDRLQQTNKYDTFKRSFINSFISVMMGEYHKAGGEKARTDRVREALRDFNAEQLPNNYFIHNEHCSFYQMILNHDRNDDNINQNTQKNLKQLLKENAKQTYAKFNVGYRYDNYLLNLEKQNWYAIQELKNKLNNENPYARNYYITANLNLSTVFCNRNIKSGSVLLVEANIYHGEVLSSLANYLLQLGYHVDVLIRPELAAELPFADYTHKNLSVFPMELFAIKQTLSHPIIAQYEHLIFNSELLWDPVKTNTLDFFNIIYPPQKRIINVVHNINLLSRTSAEKSNLIVLNDNLFNQQLNTTTIYALPPEKKYHHAKQNNKVNFLAIGNFAITSQRNPEYLFQAVRDLMKNQEFNFEITIIGRFSNVNIPQDISAYFKPLDKLDSQDLNKQVKECDFLLTLLDPQYYPHQSYLNHHITGSFNLTFGFAKPCLIPQKFATTYHLNQNNALIIDDECSLAQTIKKAIDLEPNQYDLISEQLSIEADKMRKTSINNLRSMLS